MSMTGERALRLERARLEALRLEQVRREGHALMTVCEATVAGVRDVAVQQFAAAELRELVGLLREAGARVEKEPDAGLKELQGLQLRLSATVTAAQARAWAWSEAQAQAQASLDALAGRIEAVTVAEKNQASPNLKEARRLMELARTHAGGGAQTELRQCLELAERSLESARADSLDEKTRKEVVRGLLATLRDMGFVVVGPTLSEDLVALEGQLPSGRRARFEVKVDGQLRFDLDGYEGRTCAEEMEKVETAMRDRFGVTMGPPQVVWKNPERLSQGALELPGGNRSRGGR